MLEYSVPHSEEPIRSEPFGASRLKGHAQSLAESQKVSFENLKVHGFLNRLRENEKILEKGYVSLTKAQQEKRALTPTAEYFLDHFHVVRAQIREIQDRLAKCMTADLPQLVDSEWSSFPRIYVLAWEFISHTESHFESESLKSYLWAYQSIQSLTLDELAALPTALRLVFIENLRRLMPRILESQNYRQENEDLLTRSMVLNTLRSSHQMLRFEWQDLLEEVSVVEKTLRFYPLYAEVDFATRKRYRSAIQELSRYSNLSEVEIAQKLIEKHPMDPGHFLFGDGRESFESEIRFHAPLGLELRRLYRKKALPLYLTAFSALTFCFALIASLGMGWATAGWTLLLVLGLFPASQLALNILNRGSSLWIPPHHLPRFRFKSGIPAHARTFVVVSALLKDEEDLDRKLSQLEVHSLSNPENNIYFALLTDWPDATEEISPDDLILLDIAAVKLAKLNAKYPLDAEGFPKFYIFHRRRLFNPKEGPWMGWQRKRGQLHEFNQLLLGNKNTSYIPLEEAEIPFPSDIRYVLALDPDTRLPNGTASQLIGTIAHPLNQPQLDEALGRVTKGYGLLQPRITPTLPLTTESTLFQELSMEPSGIGLYSSNDATVYQDLFEEGTFTGNGIYNVAVFEKALTTRIPENTLASQNILDGNYLRCAALEDIELFEDDPSHTEVAAGRSYYWIRSDWQLLPWIFGRGGSSVSALNRWKILDHLRRSLVTPMSFALLVTAMFLSADTNTTGWVLITLLAIASPTAMELIKDLSKISWRSSLWQNLGGAFADFAQGFQRFVLAVALMPHHSLLAVKAVSTSVYRQHMSRKKRLEARKDADFSATDLGWNYFLKSYREDLILVFAITVALAVFMPSHLIKALPLLLLWSLSPFIARHASSAPKPKQTKPLEFQDVQFLQNTARRVWQYFTTFVTVQDRFLPPENYQEVPTPEVSHKTSPMNMGLYLMSVLSARDFGWTGTFETADRLEKTLQTLDQLPRYQGHFYNWYDTLLASPLEPHYISTVDSGHLAAHLLTVEQGCLEILNAPLTYDQFAKSLLKTLDLCDSALSNLPKSEPLSALLREFKLNIIKFDRRTPVKISRWETVISNARDLLKFIEDIHQKNQGHASSQEALVWAQAVFQDASSVYEDLKIIFQPQDLGQIFFVGTAEQQKEWDQIIEKLSIPVALKDLESHYSAMIQDVLAFKRSLGPEVAAYLDKINTFRKSLEDNQQAIRRLCQRLENAAGLCAKLFQQMDFKLLYDPSKKLFSMGYNVDQKNLDSRCFDLLGSEARLTSFIAIAKSDVSPSHWFHLGRDMTYVKNGAALISWSGSMFEYLMPSLVMPAPEGSLVDKTCQFSVLRQIQYGSERKVPWGISESSYNLRDPQSTYRYANFGVPDLGLKRGLESDLVVAPYATLLAAMYETLAAVDNLKKLQALGGQGVYGFYDAIDFTPSRVPEGQTGAVVQTYMSHHQGMSLVALTNVLKEGVMRRRFHAHPLVQSAELLLQERMPKAVSFTKPFEKLLPASTSEVTA